MTTPSRARAPQENATARRGSPSAIAPHDRHPRPTSRSDFSERDRRPPRDRMTMTRAAPPEHSEPAADNPRSFRAPTAQGSAQPAAEAPRRPARPQRETNPAHEPQLNASGRKTPPPKPDPYDRRRAPRSVSARPCRPGDAPSREHPKATSDAVALVGADRLMRPSATSPPQLRCRQPEKELSARDRDQSWQKLAGTSGLRPP